MSAPRVVCCGEALIDLLGTDPGGRTWRAVPGGSPFNAAIAAGRLGAPTSFLGVLSEDRFGRMLAEQLHQSHVESHHCPMTREPTTLALVDHGFGDDDPEYSFHVAGTTTTSARVNDLHLPNDTGVLHVSGSVALVVEPAASRIESLLAAAQHRAVVHLDPNPRPSLIDRARFLRRLDRWLTLADVIKVSEADLAWIEPRQDPLELAAEWLHGAGDHQPDDVVPDERPTAVVVTRGARGAAAVTTSGVVEVPGKAVQVIDTVGAGDTFSGAMLAALSSHRITTKAQLVKLDMNWWRTALTYAVAAAGITCSRVGADPPWRHQLH